VVEARRQTSAVLFLISATLALGASVAAGFAARPSWVQLLLLLLTLILYPVTLKLQLAIDNPYKKITDR
jgi:hypothetical protein